MKSIVVLAAAVAAASVLVAACTPHKVTENPEPPVAVPQAWHGAGAAEEGGAALPEQWWRDFQDGRLDALVERAFHNNLQVRAAWVRIQQSRALVAQANSGKWPQVDLSASAGRQSSRFFIGGQEIENTNNSFAASIGAAYELDLWQRMANQGRSATLNLMAARDDYEAAAIGIAAEVAEAWFDIVAYRAQKVLIEDQLRTNDTYLELVDLRFQKGLASALDVFQQRQQQAATRAQLALIDAALRLFEHRLAVLLGEPPGAVQIEAADALPESLPPVPATGLPADLLERRPDLRAARRRVEAADYQVAVAVANRLPTLRLSGSYGYQSTDITQFLSSPVWSLIASVTQSIFDGGRRKAEVERSKAVVEELLLGYGQVLLVAMTEVENALVQERQQLLYIEDLEATAELAAATLREAQARYSQGLSDYLPVLSALQAQQRAELTLLQARRQLLSYRIQLCRALGGTWTQSLSAPEREEEPS
ncbi:efflux transporter outer membrane subunit [Haliangium sp.]|uniref:efflux transporter outer membrane subunit n=1 Tax=Haliangium sp. TaxID=2663208 RepID=UPI003D131A8F